MPNKLKVPAMWSEQTGAVVAKQNELAAGVYSSGQTFEQMREGYRKERVFWNDGGPVPASTIEEDVTTRHGRVRVRMHRPDGAAVLPGIVYVHGGGWVLGDLDTHDRITRTLAEKTGAAVVAVDYTLSPEARFPRALEECVDVVLALKADSDKWGLDPRKLALAGDSGGASLALGAFLHLRGEEKAAEGVAALLLFYGAFGLRDSMSMRLFGGEWDGLTEEDFAWYKGLYLADAADERSPYVDLLANDLTETMPPCYIAAAGLDPLRDDSRTLAAMLASAGGDVEAEEFPDVIHGFLHHSRMLDAARGALAHASDFFRSRVGKAPASTQQTIEITTEE